MLVRMMRFPQLWLGKGFYCSNTQLPASHVNSDTDQELRAGNLGCLLREAISNSRQPDLLSFADRTIHSVNLCKFSTTVQMNAGL